MVLFTYMSAKSDSSSQATARVETGHVPHFATGPVAEMPEENCTHSAGYEADGERAERCHRARENRIGREE